MKYKLRSGEVKEYEEMTEEEKEEWDKDFVKGLLISGGILGGLFALDKL